MSSSFRNSNNRSRHRRGELLALAAAAAALALAACSLYTWNKEYGQAPQLVSYVIIGSLISVIPLVIAFLSLQRFWRSGLAAGSITL
jgi:ABC-type maltose transport system permease subunit